jgi:hypothetical protein
VVQIIEVTGFGVRSAILRLRRTGSPMQFVVYPMIHIGSSAFYEEVSNRLRRAQLIVAEGVKDGGRPSVLSLALTLSYRVVRFNRRVNLDVQDIDYEALGVPVVNPDVTTDEFRTSWSRIPIASRLLVWCVLPVVVLGRLVGATSAIWTKATEVNDLPSDEDERLAESQPELMHAMLDERDERLLACLSELHEERGAEEIEVAVVLHSGPSEPAAADTSGGAEGEAVEVAEEAVEVWRAVAVAYPVDRGDLARSLAFLADLQRGYGVGDRGSARADEAEAIARDIAADYPEPGRRLLATVLPRVARVLDAVGEPERARAIREEMDAHA